MGLFDLFGRKEKRLKEAIDLSVLSTDIHSHLIPGVDDGSPDMETSIALMRELESLGYRKIITTPHIKTDVYDNEIEGLDKLGDELRHRAKMEGINLEIEVGAEHLIDDGFHRRLEQKRLKTFSGKHLLIELPFIMPPMGLNDYLFELQLAGYKLILAHPERYLYWLGDFDKFEKLKDRGILFQLNIMSLGGYFGKDVLYLAKKLIDNDMVELLGSDTHHYRHIEAIRNSLYSPALDKLIKSNAIINRKF